MPEYMFPPMTVAALSRAFSGEERKLPIAHADDKVVYAAMADIHTMSCEDTSSLLAFVFQQYCATRESL